MFSKYLIHNFIKITKTANVMKRNYAPARPEHGRVTNDTVTSLKGLIGDNNVQTDDATREQHSYDESHHPPAMPDVVVFPESVDHVSKVAKLCNDKFIPLIPYGTGTGVEGGVNALHAGVSMDMRKMDKVLEVNDLDFDATIQPGVTREALNRYCRDTGMWFPIDPGADCSVCGMCATNASGTNAVRYGAMRENVLNLQVVLPNGHVIYTAGRGKRSRKTSAGYNLTNLFVGSEGTLGIITQATIRMHGIPERTIAIVCHFKRVEDAVETVIQILSSCIPVAKCEFLDDKAIDAFNKYSGFSMPVAHSLFIEIHGSPAGLDQQLREIRLKGKEERYCPDQRGEQRIVALQSTNSLVAMEVQVENNQVVPRNNAEHLRVMIAAVDAVISGSMSQREAAKVYSIPRSTLRSHLPRHDSYKHRFTKTPPNFKGKTILSKKEEKELVNYIINMHRAGFGRTRQDLLYKVQDLLNKSSRKTKFENNLPNDEWYDAFIERHKDSIQQCSFGSDMQEIGLIPLHMHGVSQIIEATVQSVPLPVHPDSIFHHDDPAPPNVIHRATVCPESVARCRTLPFQFQLSDT